MCVYSRSGFYQICSTRCRNKLTKDIATQQAAPKMIGFAPVFTSFTSSVLSPTAPIAATMRNLLSCFKMLKISFAAVRVLPVHKAVKMVVMRDAAAK